MNNKALFGGWLFILFAAPLLLFSQSTVNEVSLQLPNQKINVAFLSQQNAGIGEWHIKASYNNNGKNIEVVSHIDVELSRSDRGFSKELKLLRIGEPIFCVEEIPSPVNSDRAGVAPPGLEKTLVYDLTTHTGKTYTLLRNKSSV